MSKYNPKENLSIESTQCALLKAFLLWEVRPSKLLSLKLQDGKHKFASELLIKGAMLNSTTDS